MAATVEDVILSMYYKVNSYADSIGLGFESKTSIESVSTALEDDEDKLILVVSKTSDKSFLNIEFKILISLASTKDVNSVRYTEILTGIMAIFRKYSKVCVYKADGLKQVPSVFIDTLRLMVVVEAKQDIMSIAQMRNNLAAVNVKLSGYID